jgi:septal ring factor EnvC (AmiA/AmiB activator)
MTPGEMAVAIERHEQHIKSLQHQVDEIKAEQSELRAMNQSLITMTNEIKHINANVTDLKCKVDGIESQPRARLNQIVAALLAAAAGGLVTMLINGWM